MPLSPPPHLLPLCPGLVKRERNAENGREELYAPALGLADGVLLPHPLKLEEWHVLETSYHFSFLFAILIPNSLASAHECALFANVFFLVLISFVYPFVLFQTRGF